MLQLEFGEVIPHSVYSRHTLILLKFIILVAQRSNNPNAVHSRSILLNVGIDVNSSINLVPLKTGLHRRLHSNSYYALVDRMLTNAYESADGNLYMQQKNVR